jgi:transcriptional regulator with XRE-family HTH domain
MTTSTFGSKLRRLREGAGFDSMRAFALAAGVTPKLIDLYETGKLSSPKYSTAVKFAAALKCSVDELMAGTDAAGPAEAGDAA